MLGSCWAQAVLVFQDAKNPAGTCQISGVSSLAPTPRT
jgi:hypothetical protein